MFIGDVSLHLMQIFTLQWNRDYHQQTTERLIKLREAKEEAEKEIAKFKASKEQYFQKFTKEQLEVGGTNNELQQKKVQIIYNIKQKTQQKRPDIVKFVVDNVINVNTDLEQEQEAFIEKKKKGIF